MAKIKKERPVVSEAYFQQALAEGARIGTEIQEAGKLTPMPQKLEDKPDAWTTFKAGFSNALTYDNVPTSIERGDKAFQNKKKLDSISYRDSILADTKISPEDKDFLITNGVMDEEHKSALLSYRDNIKQNAEVLSKGNTIAGITGSVLGASVSPESIPLLFLGGGKLFKAGYDATKVMEIASTINDLNKVRKVEALSALRDQALLGGLSGAMYDKHLTDLGKQEENHTLLAGTIGAILGGGMGYLIESKAFNVVHQAAFDKYISEAVSNSIVPDIQKSIFNNRLTGAPIQYLMSSVSPRMREFATNIAEPILATYNGIKLKTKDTLRSIRDVHIGEYDGMATKFDAVYAEAKQNGFKGTVDDFSNHIGMLMRDMIEKEKNEVYQFNEAFHNKHIQPLVDELKTISNRIPEKMQLSKELKKVDKLNTTSLEGLTPDIIKKMKQDIKLSKKKIKELQQVILEKEQQVVTNNSRKVDIKVRIEVARQIAAEEEANFIKGIQENKHITGTPLEQKAILLAKNYTKYMLRTGKNAGEKVLTNVHENLTYLPTDYNFQAFSKLTEAQAMYHIKTAAARVGSTMTDKQAQELYTKFRDFSIDAEIGNFSFLTPKDLNINTHINNMKLNLDRGYLAKQGLISSNVKDVLGHYSYHNSRRFAMLEKFGTTDTAEIRANFIEPIRQELIQMGANDKQIGNQIKQLEALLSDTLGMYRMDKNKSLTNQIVRVSGALDMLTYGGGFSLNAFAEIGTALWKTGLKAIFDGEFKDAVLAVNKAMYKGGKIDNELMNEVTYCGAIHDLYARTQFSKKMAAGVHDLDGFEHKMHNATDFMSKWTGLKGLTVSSQMFVGANIMKKIARYATDITKLTKKEADDFLRLGIDKEDFALIKTEMDRISELDANGNLIKFNLEKMDEGISRKIKVAAKRAIEETILTHDGHLVPAWLVKGDEPLIKLFTRFLNYPIQATNAILARGIATDKAGLFVATTINTLAYISIKYLQEQGQLAVGAKEKKNAEFDFIDNPDHLGRTINRGLSMSSGLGILPIIYQDVSTLTGLKVSNEYVPPPMSLLGPSLNRVTHVHDFMANVVKGNVGDAVQYKTMRNLVPGLSVPFLSELYKVEAKKYKGELNSMDTHTFQEFENAFSR